jgi:molybdopterin molybdotransferase
VFRQRGDRVTYYPASIAPPKSGDQLPCIRLLPWQGSADLRALADAQMLAIFPAGEHNYAPGDLVDILQI